MKDSDFAKFRKQILDAEKYSQHMSNYQKLVNFVKTLQSSHHCNCYSVGKAAATLLTEIGESDK